MSDLYHTRTIYFRKNEVNHRELKFFQAHGMGQLANEARWKTRDLDLLYHRLATSVCYKIVQGNMIIVWIVHYSKPNSVYFLPSKRQLRTQVESELIWQNQCSQASVKTLDFIIFVFVEKALIWLVDASTQSDLPVRLVSQRMTPVLLTKQIFAILFQVNCHFHSTRRNLQIRFDPFHRVNRYFTSPAVSMMSSEIWFPSSSK